jgi:ABC-type antimicrobial peptide transport system permease subunit
VKKSKILAIVVSIALVTSIVAAVFGLRQNPTDQSKSQGYKTLEPWKSAFSSNFTDPIQPNATRVQCPPSLMFYLLLTNDTVSIPRGEFLTLPVTINELGEAANITMRLVETDPEINQLPPGITVTFDQPSLTIAANSTVTTSFTISIGNGVAVGTYSLLVAGCQYTNNWLYDDAVPIRVTVSYHAFSLYPEYEVVIFLFSRFSYSFVGRVIS